MAAFKILFFRSLVFSSCGIGYKTFEYKTFPRSEKSQPPCKLPCVGGPQTAIRVSLETERPRPSLPVRPWPRPTAGWQPRGPPGGGGTQSSCGGWLPPTEQEMTHGHCFKLLCLGVTCYMAPGGWSSWLSAFKALLN